MFLATTTSVILEPDQEAGFLQVFGRSVPGSGSPTEAVGACPFSERIYMALDERGLPYVVTCIDEDDMPTWFLAIKQDWSLPALRDGDEWIFGADEINAHLNERYKKESDPFIIPLDIKSKVDKL